MADENSPASGNASTSKKTTSSRAITLNVTSSSGARATKTVVKEQDKIKPETLDERRIRIYHQQITAIDKLSDIVFPIESLRQQFVEVSRFSVAQQLDKRGIPEMDKLYVGFDHLYVVDDLLTNITNDLPIQADFAWLIYSAGRNHLNIPIAYAKPQTSKNSLTLKGSQINNPLKDPSEELTAPLCSVSAYVLANFGVTSYTTDRALFIGNIAGYLFASYYCAHLKLNYSVTPAKENTLQNYDYCIPDVVSNTEQVQALSLSTKKKIYQLAVLCAQVSLFRVNKAIERMLIADVNDFDKKKEQSVLANILRYGG